MKQLLILCVLVVNCQQMLSQSIDEKKLSAAVQEFHQMLVDKNIVAINQHTDKALTFGHSNGWVQTKTDIIKDFETNLISYQSYKQDSTTILINNNVASVRFIADITATVKGNQATYHLKVLEVWIKKGKRWLLFARQAVKV